MGNVIVFQFSKPRANYSQFGQTIGMGLVIAEIAYGCGRPAYYLTPHQYQEVMKYLYGEWLQVRLLVFTY